VGIRHTGAAAERYHDGHISESGNTHGGNGIESVAGVNPAVEYGGVRRLHRFLRQQAWYRRDSSWQVDLHPAMVDYATADEPEQHAGHPGTGHAQQEPRPGGPGRRPASSRRGANDHRQDKEGAVMT